MSDKRTIRELQQNLVRAEAALSEMTHDRDLWASDHEEDCPNLTLLDLSRDENTELKTQVAQLQATLQEQFNAARSLAETVVKMDADKAQLQATICTLRSVLEELIDGIESGGGCDGNGDVFDLGPAIAALNEAKK